MRILKRTLMYLVMTFIDETECLITHHTIFKIYSWQFCISNVPMHSISDPLKTQRWNLGCTWHCIARTVEFENTSDNSCTPRQTDAKKASSVAEGERRNRWEIQRERRKSKKWRGWRKMLRSQRGHTVDDILFLVLKPLCHLDIFYVFSVPLMLFLPHRRK